MSTSENPTSKNSMSEEDRRKLCEKLDKELDEYINSLPKRQREDQSVPPERWEEELVNHPFFMKEPPKPGDKMHPLYEGLQHLKYSPDENEPHELALAYKEDGNFNFKYKNYRLAIVAYTEGIKQKCNDPDIESSLYNNRSACHWFLKNYRSCLNDCELALKFKPNYEKVLIRVANCCFNIKKYDKGIEYCDLLLDINKYNKEVLELRKNCVQAAKLKERDDRKRNIEIKRQENNENKLIQEIIKRGYKIEGSQNGLLDLSKLEPCFPQLVDNKVFLDEKTNNIVWPVVFLYPEYKMMDYIQQFSENDTFLDQLYCVFENNPEWDSKKEYNPQNLNVYFETPKQKVVKVNVEKTLKEILQTEGYVIRAGTPSFIVLVKNSPAEQHLLSNQ